MQTPYEMQNQEPSNQEPFAAPAMSLAVSLVLERNEECPALRRTAVTCRFDVCSFRRQACCELGGIALSASQMTYLEFIHSSENDCEVLVNDKTYRQGM